MNLKKLIVAKPRGFCAGVQRAVDTLEAALCLYQGPIYVRRELVHNNHVIESFRMRRVIFVEQIEDVPNGSTVIFSAHGVSPEVRIQAVAKHLQIIDATCPLVTKVHQEAIRFAREGLSIILVGHEGHDEVIGTMGEVPGRIKLVGSAQEARTIQVCDPSRVALITQTTLSVDDTKSIIEILKTRFPALIMPSKDDICYATQHRQMAVKVLARECELIFVLGSRNSSNSNRLKEVAEAMGARTHLVEDVTAIDTVLLEDVECVGVTAGASSPEYLIHQVVEHFRALGIGAIEEISLIEENVKFDIPLEFVTRY